MLCFLQTISYMAERIVRTGSFGIVLQVCICILYVQYFHFKLVLGANTHYILQAKCLETGETVAIKKVLQDKRYKNGELHLMHVMDHPNAICSVEHVLGFEALQQCQTNYSKISRFSVQTQQRKQHQKFKVSATIRFQNKFSESTQGKEMEFTHLQELISPLFLLL